MISHSLESCSGSQTKKRSTTSVNAYLLLKQEDKILLYLRQNTGYCDGMWSLVAGHIEENESATEGMIREASEEIGVDLSHPAQIQVVHIMHRKSDRLNIDVFFDCPSWQGTLHNREPEKCEKLEFFSFNSLPENTIGYIVIALRHILDGIFYSELGWNDLG